MIEIFSNFFLIHINDKHEITSIINKSIKKYVINSNNFASILDTVIINYKNFECVVILYDNSESIKMFLYNLLQKHLKVTDKKEIEDILLMNDCIFL